MRSKAGYQFFMFICFLIIVVIVQHVVDAEEGENPVIPMGTAWDERETWGYPSLHLPSELHPFQVERELWHTGFLTVAGEFEDVHVRIRGRGNSTWDNAIRNEIEKLPLRIRFDEETYLLNSADAHRDWILMANAFDFSLLRNHFVFYLAELMGGTGFVPTAQNVHLYVNGDYVGVYQVVDERDIGPGRLDLHIDPDPTLSEYMIQMGERGRPHRIDSRFCVGDLRYGFSLPRRSERTIGHDEYVVEHLTRFSQALQAHDWDLVATLIDLDSFVEFYLIQELARNIDVRTSSVFMQIRGQGEQRRLHMGPVWDFDVALGILPTGSDRGGLENTPEGIWVADRHYWFRNLLHMPAFRVEVVQRWNEMVEVEIPLAIAEIERLSTTYLADFNRNFDRHEISNLRCIGGYCANASFSEHIDYLIGFTLDRAAYLSDFFNHPDLEMLISPPDEPFIEWRDRPFVCR